MSDTLKQMIGRVQQRVGTLPDYFLVQDTLVNAWRDVWGEQEWTFRRASGQFLFYLPYTTGTAAITRGNNYATLAGGAVIDSAWVGRQFRASVDTPIMNIASVDAGAGTITFEEVWGEADYPAGAYEIYQAFVTAPADFDSFRAVVDLRRGFQLNWWEYTIDDLNRQDARRSNGGSLAVAVVFRDYTPAGLMRFEVWPHIKANEARPYLYHKTMPDLTDASASLPLRVQGNLLVEKALANIAAWHDEKNKYYDLKLAMLHEAKFEKMLDQLKLRDAATDSSDLTYDNWLNLPTLDSSYLAGHDIGFEIDVLD